MPGEVYCRVACESGIDGRKWIDVGAYGLEYAAGLTFPPIESGLRNLMPTVGFELTTYRMGNDSNSPDLMAIFWPRHDFRRRFAVRKTRKIVCKSVGYVGAHSRIRTDDLPLTRRLLYP